MQATILIPRPSCRIFARLWSIQGCHIIISLTFYPLFCNSFALSPCYRRFPPSFSCLLCENADGTQTKVEGEGGRADILMSLGQRKVELHVLWTSLHFYWVNPLTILHSYKRSGDSTGKQSGNSSNISSIVTMSGISAQSFWVAGTERERAGLGTNSLLAKRSFGMHCA